MSPKDDSQAARTKAQILEIALEILEEQGANALKVRAIADRAELSVSMVNHYFGSKQGLLDACKKRYYEGLAEVVAAVLSESKGAPIHGIIDLAIRDTFSYSRVHRAVLRMLTRDVFADGQLIDDYRTAPKRPHFNPMIEFFAPLFGVTPQVARIRLQAVSVVLTRFATSNPPELEAIFGLTGDDAVAAAEDHMVEIALQLLLSREKHPAG